MQLEIRPAVGDDIAAIFAIRTDVTENHLSLEQLAELGITPQTIKEMISASPGTWVASVEGQICGFSMADTETGGVFALFVKRGWEGRGIGTRLMEPVETLLFARHETIWLSTERNSRASRFYSHHRWSGVKEMDNGETRFEKSKPV